MGNRSTSGATLNLSVADVVRVSSHWGRPDSRPPWSVDRVTARVAREGLWLFGSIVTALPVAWFALRPPLEPGSTTTLVSAALWFGLLLGLATYAGLTGIRFASRLLLRACRPAASGPRA